MLPGLRAVPAEEGEKIAKRLKDTETIIGASDQEKAYFIRTASGNIYRIRYGLITRVRAWFREVKT